MSPPKDLFICKTGTTSEVQNGLYWLLFGNISVQQRVNHRLYILAAHGSFGATAMTKPDRAHGRVDELISPSDK